MNKLKRWLAKKLDPNQARLAERYLWLQSEIQQAHRWLGEFEEVDETLRWLMFRDIDHWRSLGTPAINKRPAGISEFREFLRSRKKEEK